MKVAFLLGSLNRGGLETLLLDVCRSLKEEDFEAIGVYRKGGVLEEQFMQSGVEFNKIATTKNPLSYVLRLRKLIKAKNIDIIHAQQPIDALYGYLASIGLNTKLMLTLHGFNFSAKDRLLKFILKKTDENIYVSNYQKDFYIQEFGLNTTKQSVVYNGIDFAKFSIEHTEETLRKELNIGDDKLLLGTVGNFNEVRDQMTICRFLKMLKAENIDFHFVFVGKRVESSPKRFDDCVEFCSENGIIDHVSFLGVRQDVPKILPQLDSFIYSTDHDTFGIALVEAIASGKPVFVNDWVVMREVTENGLTANIYKTKDEEDLFKKFIAFLQDKEKHLAKAEISAKHIKDKFSIENHIKSLKFRFSQILNN